jgi:hypothetical protein
MPTQRKRKPARRTGRRLPDLCAFIFLGWLQDEERGYPQWWPFAEDYGSPSDVWANHAAEVKAFAEKHDFEIPPDEKIEELLQ